MNKHFSHLVLAIFIFHLTACPPLLAAEDNKGKVVLRIRVLIEEAKTISLTTTGDYWLYDEVKGEEVLYGGNSFNFQIQAADAGLKISYAGTFAGPVRLIPVDDAKVKVRDQLYRGELLAYSKNGQLFLINYVDLEEYLYGVIRKEISPNWPIDAVKAQAIAARTYGFYQMVKNQSLPFDLDDTTKSQLYGGFKSEAPASIQAVDETKGEIITYEGEPIQALFHSNCGGETEDVKNVFGNSEIPYLKSVPCQYGKDTSHYTWQQEIPLKQIISRLKEKNYSLSSIRSIAIETQKNSRRVMLVKINSGNSFLTLTGKEFREVFGYNLVKSTLFEVSLSGDKAIFNGHGWGHGVGLCQDGMKGMAEAGYNYQQILQYYYLGTKVETLYDIYQRAGFASD